MAREGRKEVGWYSVELFNGYFIPFDILLYFLYGGRVSNGRNVLWNHGTELVTTIAVKLEYFLVEFPQAGSMTDCD